MRFPFQNILIVVTGLASLTTFSAPVPATCGVKDAPVRLFPLASIRLLKGPFTPAIEANRNYMLALDPDRLLAPFRREAGLGPRKPAYGNWESSGLGGHMAGHYLSALSYMVASGNDTPDRQLQRRLDYMISELVACQKAFGDGYVGGVPGSRALWKEVAAGKIDALKRKWVPWYNVHKTFAGLRDAWLLTGNPDARDVLIRLGDWCERVTHGLSDAQMQAMLEQEHGGMNEVLADLYAITGDVKYLNASRRFCHKAVLDPLIRHEDRLTGLHANTQIPKVIGLERIAMLTGDKKADSGARFFWENVTSKRSVAFGGDSVSEHFNDPKNFRVMLERREGPESCNSYNMLKLTEMLFASEPKAVYADFYERTLFNHLLSAINPIHPGFVYFTPIRPEHYRVYSQPDQCMWCCVGTGMENPGRYGQFIYARARDGLYVNLFIASELSMPELGLTLRQATAFPDEAKTRLTLQLKAPLRFTLHLRHPGWVAAGAFSVRVNGEAVAVAVSPSSYQDVTREWKNGDCVEIGLPMHTTVEDLPDGSGWYAIMHGPIVLAAPDGTQDMAGLRATDGRMSHIAKGPLVPFDKVPALVTSPEELPSHVVPDPAAGPLHFRIKDVVDPPVPGGVALEPFFRIQDERYQMYWELATKEQIEARRARVAAAEGERAALEAATLDMVTAGDQQSEVEHGFKGESTNTGVNKNRCWRDARGYFQYSLNSGGARAAELAVTYWGGDNHRRFDISANQTVIASESLDNPKPGTFVVRHYPLPPSALPRGKDGSLTIRFAAKPGSMAGGVYEVRLLSPGAQP